MKALTDTPGAPTGPPPTRPGTIYQVAQRAGVSIATVSRALRGTVPVAPTTRERVLRAVAELDYTPSRPARSLAEGRQEANGIVFPDLSGPYFAEVVLGYEEIAAEEHRGVLILSTHGREAADDMVLDLAARVDGMVVLGRTVGDATLHELIDKGLPLVLLARDPIAGVDCLNAENERSAHVLTTHLSGTTATPRSSSSVTRRPRPTPMRAGSALPRPSPTRVPGCRPDPSGAPSVRSPAAPPPTCSCASGRRGPWSARTTRSRSAPSRRPSVWACGSPTTSPSPAGTT
jgi:transcriptional regulator with XRE-family HTH domain